MRASSADSPVAPSGGGDGKDGDGAKQQKGQGRANGANKTSAMRETLHFAPQLKQSAKQA